MGISLIIAWSVAFGFMLLFLLLALLLSNNVPYMPGGRDKSKRRVQFWIFCALTPLFAFGVNAIITTGIDVPALRTDYLVASGIAAGVALLVFVIIGAVISKSSSGKLQDWAF